MQRLSTWDLGGGDFGRNVEYVLILTNWEMLRYKETWLSLYANTLESQHAGGEGKKRSISTFAIIAKCEGKGKNDEGQFGEAN